MIASATLSPSPGPRRLPGPLVLGLALVTLLSASVASLGAGAVGVPPGEVLRALAAGLGLAAGAVDPLHQGVVWDLRLPRALLGLLTGASLGVAGALTQGWFRNPLAEPGTLGVSQGAVLGAASVLVLGPAVLPAGLPALGVPTAAFAGALGAVALVYQLGARPGARTVDGLLLAGIAVNAATMSATGLLLVVADDAAIRNLTFWTLGSLAGASWDTVRLLALPLVVGVGLALTRRRALDALLLGAATAEHLGLEPRRVRREITLLVAGLVGLCVSATGPIGFVGLVAPHLVRLACGPRHRWVLPGAALTGAALVVLADLGARTLATPLELPLGALTTLVGAPLFLGLLLRDQRRAG